MQKWSGNCVQRIAAEDHNQNFRKKCVKRFSVGTGPQPVTIQYLQAQ